MNEKMREFVKGMLPGLPGKPHPMANKEPVAYLYNGVEPHLKNKEVIK